MKTVGRVPRVSLIGLVGVAILLPSCVTRDSERPAAEFSDSEVADYGYSVPPPDDFWRTAAPNPASLDTATLDRGIRAIMAGEYRNVHSVLVAHRGVLVFEQYFPGYSFDGEWVEHDRKTPHRLASLSKSITGLAVGVAMDQGAIDLDSSVVAWFPEYDHRDREKKESILIRHLLTMQTGLECNEWELPLSSRYNDLNRYYRSQKPNQFVLGRDLVAKPGTEFCYNTPSTHVLGELIQRAVGESFDEYMNEALFEPLGIDNAHWRPNDTGVPGTTTAGDGLSLAPRDLLRIGQLILQRGIWQGQQVVPEAWLDEVTTPRVPLWEGVHYGYLWWRMEQEHPSSDAVLSPFIAGGNGGQWLMIYPDLELIVATTGGSYLDGSDTCFSWLMDYLLPAIAVK